MHLLNSSGSVKVKAFTLSICLSLFSYWLFPLVDHSLWSTIHSWYTDTNLYFWVCEGDNKSWQFNSFTEDLIRRNAIHGLSTGPLQWELGADSIANFTGRLTFWCYSLINELLHFICFKETTQWPQHFAFRWSSVAGFHLLSLCH